MNTILESNQSITSSDMQPFRMHPFQENTALNNNLSEPPPVFPGKMHSVPRTTVGYPCFSLRKLDLSSRRQWSHKAKVHNVPVDAKFKANKQSQRNRRTRRVRFAPHTTEIKPTSKPTREEIKKQWYCPKDYEKFVTEIQTVLSQWRGVGGDMRVFDEEKYCTRGLEQQLQKGNALVRRMRNQRYTRYVLEQQSVQRYCGIHDPETLREVSLIFSTHDSQRAHMDAVLNYSLNCSGV